MAVLRKYIYCLVRRLKDISQQMPDSHKDMTLWVHDNAALYKEYLDIVKQLAQCNVQSHRYSK